MPKRTAETADATPDKRPTLDPQCFLVIDPGPTMGLAIVHEKDGPLLLEVHHLPQYHSDYVIATIIWFETECVKHLHKVTGVVIEIQPTNLGFKKPGQYFNFQIEATLRCMLIPCYIPVFPTAYRRWSGTSRGNYKENKRASVTYCLAKYPGFAAMLPKGERAHDTADCCVMAEYAFAHCCRPLATPKEMLPTIHARLTRKPGVARSAEADSVHSDELASDN